MKILIDMWHPADVHFFRNFIQLAKKNNHQIIIASRKNKDVTTQLLDEYNFTHTPVSTRRSGLVGLAIELLEHNKNLYKLAKKEKPDVMIAFGGMSIAHVGALLRIPRINFYDTEHATLIRWITMPFINLLCTPKHFNQNWGKKQRHFNSFKELAYLDPKYFSLDETMESKVRQHHEFVSLVRFISWDASHDAGVDKVSLATKRNIIAALEKKGKVWISAENGNIPKEFKKYLLAFASNKFMEVLAYSDLIVSEGLTTAKEASFLGTPTIYINKLITGDAQELEKQELFFNTIKEEEILKYIEKLSKKTAKMQWQQRRDKFVKGLVDLPVWMYTCVTKFKK